MVTKDRYPLNTNTDVIEPLLCVPVLTVAV